MEKKTKTILSGCLGLLTGVILGAVFMCQYYIIQDQNRMIDALQKRISKIESERWKQSIIFGKWKMCVEDLAKENGWSLPEMMTDSQTVQSAKESNEEMRSN